VALLVLVAILALAVLAAPRALVARVPATHPPP
jgi:hypothetical protein